MFDIKRIDAAISQVSAEKKIDKTKLVDIIEAAIETAYKKDFGSKDSNVRVKLDFENDALEVTVEKRVVQNVEDADLEISLEELWDDGEYEEGDIIEIDVSDEVLQSEGFGRIASQAARQVIIQKIQDSEKEKLYDLFKDKQGTLVNMRVELVEKNRVVFDFNGTQVVLPKSEQVSKDRYTPGQRMYLYVKAVEEDSATGPRVVLTRRDVEFVTALFAMNVPELEDGTVEVVSIARMPGFKTKMIVGSEYREVDPAGCLIGPKGIRVKAVVDELFGEKVDIINYNEKSEEIIKGSLAPAAVEKVSIDEEERTATCWVKADEKAKALGKGGANITLAGELVGYRLIIETIEGEEGENGAVGEE